jgi:hypothetical protein
MAEAKLRDILELRERAYRVKFDDDVKSVIVRFASGYPGTASSARPSCSSSCRHELPRDHPDRARTLQCSPHHGGRTLNGSSPHSLRPTAGACIDELAERLQLANGELETFLTTDAAGSSANQW